MSNQEISREVKLKFMRLASQMLPKASYANALIINAGDGLVCEFLDFLGVPEVLGIEGNPVLRQQNQLKHPHMQFFESLSQLGERQFDLMIVLDKIDFLAHPIESQMFEKISKNCGYIVADLFTYDSMTESDFKVFKFSATEKMSMPTTKKLVDQFSGHIARRVDQAPTHFKNVVRSIWHFRKRLPYAVVLSQGSWSGKTTFARHVFSELTLIEFDIALGKIKRDELQVSDEVRKLVQASALWEKFGGKKIYQELADHGCYIDFVKAALSSIDNISENGIVVDGFVPTEQVDKLHQLLSDAGYYVVEISLTNVMKPDSDYSIQQMQKFYDSLSKSPLL